MQPRPFSHPACPPVTAPFVCISVHSWFPQSSPERRAPARRDPSSARAPSLKLASFRKILLCVRPVSAVPLPVLPALFVFIRVYSWFEFGFISQNASCDWLSAIDDWLSTWPRPLDFGPSTFDLGPWTLDLGPWTLSSSTHLRLLPAHPHLRDANGFEDGPIRPISPIRPLIHLPRLGFPYAKIPFTTSPATSVRRNSLP